MRRWMPAALSPLLLLALAWAPAGDRIRTRWAAQVDPAAPLPEYPRPQLQRADWQSLNGLWDYAIVARDAPRPAEFQGQILVPFPLESSLSGVAKPLTPDQHLWYRRTFEIAARPGHRVLLNFGAVDWEAAVWVNGKPVGEHRGGYDPFTFDITDALKPAGPQEIAVRVYDATDRSPQPRGKQVLKPGGIMYTAVSGIWQTPWLEQVPAAHVTGLVIVPDLDASAFRVTVQGAGEASVRVFDGGQPVAEAAGPAGRELLLKLAAPKPWSPDAPHLYDLEVRLGDDVVKSYAGLRKIEVRKDEAGVNRLFLNNRALFQYGPLDQGWWPDGLYTAPADEALRYDVETTKAMGFNLARKHVKVEPARWYYWCDRLGLMVWQDMPSGNVGDGKRDAPNSPETAALFRRELQAMIESHRNHPCIVMWVPFNEGWGQHDTAAIARWVKELDPTRLVNNASGWTDHGAGDVHDIHAYPTPRRPELEPDRAAACGEFGGLGFVVPGHLWQTEKNWGYRSYPRRDVYQAAYADLVRELRKLRAAGLAAAVYTQTSDVEIECNGLLTYDRAELKLPAAWMAAQAARISEPLPVPAVIEPTARERAVVWRYTTNAPPAGWAKPGFDDAAWAEGPAGFGRKGTPGAVVRTEWHGDAIWLRRSFDFDGRRLGEPVLALHHDEDVDIYLNGEVVAHRDGFTTDYLEESFDASKLRPGRNVIAVHCRQTAGGQYIDVGILDAHPPRP